MNTLIADSGATKCEWVLLQGGKKKRIDTTGISPYFLDATGIEALLRQELMPKLKEVMVDQVFYYGTGCINPLNVKIMKKALRCVFPKAGLHVTHDLMGAA